MDLKLCAINQQVVLVVVGTLCFLAPRSTVLRICNFLHASIGRGISGTALRVDFLKAEV